MMTPLLLAQAAGGAGNAAQAAAGPDLLLWGVILLAFAVLLMLVEAFLPTGGIVGLMAGVAAIAGLVCLTLENTTLGLLTSIVAVLAFPVAAWYLLKHAPDLPLGRMMTLQSVEQPPVPPAGPGLSLGDVGTTQTALRPMGACRFGACTVECHALDAMIDEDREVRVVDLVDGRVLVEPI